MECHQQCRSTSISRAILVYDRGWAVQANQEDGIIEMISAPVTRGFFVQSSISILVNAKKSKMDK